WMLVICFKRIDWQPIHWRLHTVRSIFGWATVTLVFWASSLMALADATAISFLTPVVALVLAIVFLGERVGIVRWSAVAIMLFGAMVLLRPGTSAFQPAALLALAAAVTSAVESTLIKRLTALESRLQILVVNNSIGLVIALSAATLVWRWPDTLQWVLLAGVGLTMAVAQVFFLTSMRDGDASFVVPFMYSTLLFAGVLDYVVFGDAPDTWGVVGACIIVAGAIFLALRESRVSRR
ncbi:MAG: DMT family transporter, partial [Pseudomonadota bacterium]